jgi:restriction system protein
MTIPDYQTFMRPVLHLAAEKERTVRECIDLVADKFSLSAEEREALLPSGKQTTLANRVHWAVTFMARAGLVQRPRRGLVVATTRGREILKEYPERIDNDVLSRFPEFIEFRERSRAKVPTAGGEAPPPPSADKDTPEERIEAAYEELNLALREDLLARITKSDPTFFEHLIIDLMIGKGYGGPGSGHHLGRTSDGGIDGIINEDPLGLDIVFLQAKRYAPGNVIGVDKVREFAGSLDERGAVKGVFVTTSHFAPQAKAYAERSHKRLILIDGEELTRLLVNYGVGVRAFRTIDFKKVDQDYFNTSDA